MWYARGLWNQPIEIKIILLWDHINAKDVRHWSDNSSVERELSFALCARLGLACLWYHLISDHCFSACSCMTLRPWQPDYAYMLWIIITFEILITSFARGIFFILMLFQLLWELSELWNILCTMWAASANILLLLWISISVKTIWTLKVFLTLRDFKELFVLRTFLKIMINDRLDTWNHLRISNDSIGFWSLAIILKWKFATSELFFIIFRFSHIPWPSCYVIIAIPWTKLRWICCCSRDFLTGLQIFLFKQIIIFGAK